MRIDHKPFIYIAVPNYSGMLWHKFTVSLIQTVLCINEMGWECAVKILPNDCMIHSARNKLVADFMASGCTHLFMLDDDIAWEPKGFINMVKADKAVISGLVPIRQGGHFAFDKGESEDGDLFEIHNVGAAFLCIKREAIKTMMKKFPELKCNDNEPHYEKYGYTFFEFTYEDGHLTGEDVNFCRRWNEIGKIWAYPDISFQHLSSTQQSGNYLTQNKPKGLRIKELT
ncbi:MAG: hypothetical protein GY861_14710 [bacterium]|nr:hypothetical protein [bacterium]